MIFDRRRNDNEWLVSVRITGAAAKLVDRRDCTGTSVWSEQVADRLAAAINAGVAYKAMGVQTDTAGKRYMHVHSELGYRKISSRLAELGF